MSPHHLDDRLLLAISHLAGGTPWLHSAMVDYTTYGVVLFGILLLAGLVLTRGAPDRTLAAIGWAGLAVPLAVALNQPIGRAVGEARPYISHPHLVVLVQRTSDFSFPSDHAVMAGAATAGLLLVSWRLGALAGALAALLAFSRVYVGAHYPWDVVVGLALGAAVTTSGWLLLRRPLTAVSHWLRRVPLVRDVFDEQPDPAPAVT
jgi:membrane-associated phospholipid phosphatase